MAVSYQFPVQFVILSVAVGYQESDVLFLAVGYQEFELLSVAVGYQELEGLSVAVSHSVELSIAAGYLAISGSGLQNNRNGRRKT